MPISRAQYSRAVASGPGADHENVADIDRSHSVVSVFGLAECKRDWVKQRSAYRLAMNLPEKAS